MTYFTRFFQSDEGAGGYDDGEPIPFGEAFGVNPDGSPYEAPAAEPGADEPDAGGGTDNGADAPPSPQAETADQAVERLYGGKYKSVEELEKAHKELTAAWDGRNNPKPAEQPAQPDAPPPSPLLKGEHGEIRTEAQLFEWAVADPEAAANFVMQNNERVSQEQMDKVMDHWISVQPWKAMTAISSWNLQIAREEFAEKTAQQEQHFIGEVRDRGIALAYQENELLNQYDKQLGEFIEANPHLNQMVEGARTPEQVSKAINAIFYMMAGPQLKTQAIEAQVQRAAAEAAAAKAAEEAAAAAASATTIGRNTGKPPSPEDDDAYGEAMRQKVLNPSGR